MRARILLSVLCVLCARPAFAQTVPGQNWEIAAEARALRREDSSKTSPGASISVARWLGAGRRGAAVIEAAGTRRAGHNDWHLLTGFRVGTGAGQRVGWFLQGLAGTVIRQGHAGWAVQPGIGLDLRWATGRLLRISVAASVDSRHGNTQSGVIGGLGLVWR